jgi:hypothetical protein
MIVSDPVSVIRDSVIRVCFGFRASDFEFRIGRLLAFPWLPKFAG